MGEWVTIAEGLKGTPIFARKKDGYSKFGKLSSVDYDGIYITLFSGGISFVRFSDLVELRPFKREVRT